MKSIKNLVLFAATLAVIFASCTKEKQTDSNLKSEAIDPRNDLAGFLNGFDNTLYVLPDNKDAVIKTLNAKPFEGNMMQITAKTISGKKVPFLFSIKEASLPLILFYVNEAERSCLDILQDKDTTRGRLINKFKDSTTGVFYRVYKNAKCVNISQAGAGDCNEDIRWIIDPKDSTIKIERTGIFIKFENQEINHCLKGNDYCVEALVVSTIKKTYDDPLCRNLLASIDWNFDYSCLK